MISDFKLWGFLAGLEFIKMCISISSSGKFKKVEVTFLLMLNRVITQTGRMLVFAMKPLLAKMDDLKLKDG